MIDKFQDVFVKKTGKCSKYVHEFEIKEVEQPPMYEPSWIIPMDLDWIVNE